jgi:hypothetical protein
MFSKPQYQRRGGGGTVVDVAIGSAVAVLIAVF